MRAPLLWLVVPMAIGIATAHQWGLARHQAPWMAGAALGLAWTAVWATRGDSGRARLLWAALTPLSASLAGAAYFLHLTPVAADLPADAPPRELRMVIHVDRVFFGKPGAKTVSGIGTVETPPEILPDLRGSRIYFSTLRRLNAAPPVRGASQRMRGVFALLPAGTARTDFDRYLADTGVPARLERGFVEEQVRPPGGLQRIAAAAERRFAAYLRRGLEERPELASVLVAMLLGEKAALTAEQELAFTRSGTAHIFSVSGLHVGVVAGAIQSLLLLLRMPRAIRVVAGLATLWFYVQVVGANPPAVRAFVMIAFLLARGLFGLPGNPLAALVAAAGLTLLIEPHQLFGVGFQLSYLVVGAIVLMGMPLAERWRKAWRPFGALPEADWRWWQRGIDAVGREILAALAITVSALTASTPATIACFGLFTPGGLLANLVIVPLASLAIVAGFLSILAGLAGVGAAGSVFNHAAALLVVIMDWLVRQGTAGPFMHFQAEFRFGWIAPLALVWPAALMLAGAAARWRKAAGGFWLPPAGVAVLLLACVRLSPG